MTKKYKITGDYLRNSCLRVDEEVFVEAESADEALAIFHDVMTNGDDHATEVHYEVDVSELKAEEGGP